MKNTKISKKELINSLIDEMVNFGEAYLGITIGENAVEEMILERCKLFKSLNKEVGKRFNGKVVCWDGESGMAWIA